MGSQRPHPLGGGMSDVLAGLASRLGSALQAGVPARAVGAAALSLALTATLMVLLDAPHPPAAATTLIISLGFLTHPNHFIVLLAAVVLLAAQDVAVNRFAGLDMPLWAPRESEPEQ